MSEKVKLSELLIQTWATFVICFLAVQTGFVCAWPSYTTALFKSTNTVLSQPMSSLEVSLLGSLPNVGGLIISPFCSYAFNTFGRKYATMLFGLPYVLSWSIISLSDNVKLVLFAVALSGVGIAGQNLSMIYISEIAHDSIRGEAYEELSWSIISLSDNVKLVLFAVALSGVGIAGQNLSMIYISEIAHDSIRGSLTSYAASGYFLGIMVSHILGGSLSYMTVVYVHLTLSVVAVLLLLLIKESPVYLVMVGKEKEAAESIAFYRRLETKSKEVEAEIAKIRIALDPRLETMLENVADLDVLKDLLSQKQLTDVPLTPSNEPSWRFLLRSKSSQRALVTVLTIMTLTIMMGCIVLQVYAEPLFTEAVPSLPPNQCAILVALDFLIASFVCAFLIDRCGRKFLLIATSAGSGICTLLLGSQLQFHWAPHWVTALLIYVYSFVFTSGCATIPFVLTAEVFLPEVRSLCNSIVFAFVWVFNFITLVMFNPLVEAVGLGLVFYLFSAVCFTGTVYSQLCVPETRGLSVTDIQKLFVGKRG